MGTSATGGECDELNCPPEKPAVPSAGGEMSGWLFCRTGLFPRLCRLLVALALRCWLVCSTAVLILLLAFWFYGGISILVLLHLAVLGILYNAQDLLLYYPDQPPSSRLFIDSPGTFRLPHKTFYIQSQDGTQLHAQFAHQCPHTMSSVPTVVLFHGNAGNIGHRLPNVKMLYVRARVNVLQVEYRGFGKSHGYPSEQGMYMDARAALDYILTRSDVCSEKVIVFGRSLGGAVALRVCSEAYYAGRVAAVIVENTFTSIPDMARAMFDFSLISYLPEWCFKNQYQSKCLVSKITIPTLFVCGLQDQLVPPRMMQQLYELSGSRMKRLALFTDGTHNETWQCHRYYDAINEFLSELEQSRNGAFVSPTKSYTADVPFADTSTISFL